MCAYERVACERACACVRVVCVCVCCKSLLILQSVSVRRSQPGVEMVARCLEWTTKYVECLC
jgi:hypothetical protein